MNSDTRKDLLRKQKQLFEEVEALNKVRTEELTYQQSVSVNSLLKMKRQKYKMICAILKGYEDERRKENRKHSKKTR